MRYSGTPNPGRHLCSESQALAAAGTLDAKESLQCHCLQSVLRLHQRQLTVFVTTHTQETLTLTIMISVGNMFKNKRDLIKDSVLASPEFVFKNNSCHSNHHYFTVGQKAYLLIVIIIIEAVCVIIYPQCN